MNQTEHLAKIRAKCVELLNREGTIPLEQAGWKSTIAAIDLILKLDFETGQTAKTIIAAWPEELL